MADLIGRGLLVRNLGRESKTGHPAAIHWSITCPRILSKLKHVVGVEVYQQTEAFMFYWKDADVVQVIQCTECSQMESRALADVAWMEQAACKGADPDLFFPPTEEGLAYCNVCPVRDRCYEWGVETKEEYGMWGGHVMYGKGRKGEWREVG